MDHDIMEKNVSKFVFGSFVYNPNSIIIYDFVYIKGQLMHSLISWGTDFTKNTSKGNK